MEATVGLSLYSYPYLKLQKCYVFLIISYVFSSTKLENKRVEQVLPSSKGVGDRVGAEGRDAPNNIYT
jgi:hypothetical protein